MNLKENLIVKLVEQVSRLEEKMDNHLRHHERWDKLVLWVLVGVIVGIVLQFVK